MPKSCAHRLLLLGCCFVGGLHVGSAAAVDPTLPTPPTRPPAETAAALFPLSIIHWNDFHARFDDIDARSDHCADADRDAADRRCFGGYARVVTTVRRLQRERGHANAVYLNAGDNFQGTFWYNVGRWNVTAQFLNALPADAIAIGNHEFSHRIDGLVPFFKLLKSPVVACNVDAAEEPELQTLFRPSVVISRLGRRVGIVGVTLSNMNTIASTGRLRFSDAVAAVRTEAARLRRQQNVRIVIVLSHCGLDTDYELARSGGPDIDVIVGGHSHSLMYSGATKAPHGEPVRDEYPAVVRQPAGGRRVLVVQASAFTRWVGDLRVWFDAEGEVVDWQGQPVFMNATVERDPQIVAMLAPWRETVRQEGAQLLGHTARTLERRPCFAGECALGNLLADAAVEAFGRQATSLGWRAARGRGAGCTMCVLHAGATRNTLHEGNITLGALFTAFPYENTMDFVQLPGDRLRQALEHSVARQRNDSDSFVAPQMLQVAGLRVAFDVRRAVGERVVDVQTHSSGEGGKWEPLETDRWYDLIVPSFLVEGGDGYTQFKEFGRNHVVGPRDIDILTDYVQVHNPLQVELSGRIKIIQ